MTKCWILYQKSTVVSSPPRAKPRLSLSQQDSTTALPVQVGDPGSPTASDVRRALEAQTAPSRKNVKSIRMFYCFYYVETTNLKHS
jgi:hypothetical protein